MLLFLVLSVEACSAVKCLRKQSTLKCWTTQDPPVLYIVVQYCHVCLFVVMCAALHCAKQWKVEWSDCHVWSGKLVVGRATSLLPICNESNFINVIAIIVIIIINIIVNIININATAAPPVSNKSNSFFPITKHRPTRSDLCKPASPITKQLQLPELGLALKYCGLPCDHMIIDPRAFVTWDLKSRR